MDKDNVEFDMFEDETLLMPINARDRARSDSEFFHNLGINER